MICFGPDGYANLAAPLPTFMAHQLSTNMYMGGAGMVDQAAAAIPHQDRGVIGQLQNMLSREYDLMQQQRFKENSGVCTMSACSSIGSSMCDSSVRLPLATKTNKPRSTRDPAKERKRKDVHNMIERKRRYNINDRIKDLAGLLPKTWTNQMKINKGSILRATVEYLKYVDCERRKWSRLRQRYRQVVEECRQLRTMSGGNLRQMSQMDGNDDAKGLSMTSPSVLISCCEMSSPNGGVLVGPMAADYGFTAGTATPSRNFNPNNTLYGNNRSSRNDSHIKTAYPIHNEFHSDDANSDLENLASIGRKVAAIISKDETTSINGEENDDIESDDEGTVLTLSDRGRSDGHVTPDFDDEDVLLRVPVSITTSVNSSRAVTITNYHYPLSTVTRKDMKMNNL